MYRFTELISSTNRQTIKTRGVFVEKKNIFQTKHYFVLVCLKLIFLVCNLLHLTMCFLDWLYPVGQSLYVPAHKKVNYN